MKPITILITDDHKLLRDTWAIIFSNDSRFNLVGVTGTGEEAVNIAKQFRPDIIIMDINLPGINGIDATQQIKKYSPSSKVLAVSFHNEPEFAREIIQKGAMGYLTKNSSQEELFKAIEEILQGRKYVCREIKGILTERMFASEEEAGLNSLSKRELEIIESVKKGCSSKEIALALNISTKTVEVHRYNILGKLNLPNSAALVNYANKYQCH